MIRKDDNIIRLRQKDALNLLDWKLINNNK